MAHHVCRWYPQSFLHFIRYLLSCLALNALTQRPNCQPYDILCSFDFLFLLHIVKYTSSMKVSNQINKRHNIAKSDRRLINLNFHASLAVRCVYLISFIEWQRQTNATPCDLIDTFKFENVWNLYCVLSVEMSMLLLLNLNHHPHHNFQLSWQQFVLQ